MVKGKRDLSIPALPAEYAGVTFRSRLEARWAYYFDLIGCPWQYEPQGFALEAGNYCPDFQCNDFYVEVKPTESDLIVAYPLLSQLSEASEARVFCVVGAPTIAPQRYWADGKLAGKASFCQYAFNGKGWVGPYFTDSYDDWTCEQIADRARKVRFNRSGIAEADWEVLKARNAIIKQRREAHILGRELDGNALSNHFKSEIEPLNARLRTLNKMAGL